MTQQPERPFVPHRTPKHAAPVASASEFRLYRPFVPGRERANVESHKMLPMSAESERQRPISLRPIEDFLHAAVPAAAVPPPVRSTDPYVAEFESQPEELPPVEHFMDPLPEADTFAPDINAASFDSAPTAQSEIPPAALNAADALETGWLETDWQHYDWHAAAALGEGVDDATRAWATTDWDGAVARGRDPAPPTASSIATALNEIARRLREGDLGVPGSAATTDPATIAATLAALLGVRR